MTSDHLVSFFLQSPLITQAKAIEIAAHFKPMVVAKNEFVLQQGQISDRYLFIECGFLRSFAIDPDGSEITTGFYGKHQVMFEVNSFFNRVPSQENIHALADTEAWYLTFQELNGLFHGLPEFREYGRSLLVKGFSSLKQRMLSMISLTAEERYAQLLKQQPEIFQYAPLKDVATYLGITDTSLSRIRKEFVRKYAE